MGLRDVVTQRNIATLSITTFWLSGVEHYITPWWPLYLLELGATELIVGVVATIQTASGVLSQLPGGFLADRFGRKRVLVYATSLRIIGGLFCIFAKSWQLFAPALIIQTVSVGLAMNASYAIVSESLPLGRRGAAFGFHGMAGMIPNVFMPILTGIQIDRYGLIRSLRFGFIIYWIVSAAGTLARALLIKETLVERENPKQMSVLKDFGELLHMRRDLVLLLIVASISGFSMRLARPFLSIYAVEVAGFTKTQWGTLESAMRGIQAALSLPAGILSDRFGRRVPIFISRILYPLNHLSLVVIPDYGKILVVYLCTGLGAGLGGGMGGPAWSALIADLVPSRDRGKMRGLMNSITSLVSMPASVIGGYLWTAINPDSLLYSAFILGIISAFTFLFMKEPKIKEQ